MAPAFSALLLLLLLPLAAAYLFASTNSCAGRCSQRFDSSQPGCACNSQCLHFGDCCYDYQRQCHGGGSSTHGSHSTLSSLASSIGGSTPLSRMADILWQLDANRFSSSDLSYNVQGHTSGDSHTDHAFRPLFTHVNEAKFSRPTYASFIALFDNYNPKSGVSEYQSASQRAEVDKFLSAIMATDVMKATLKFLQSHGTFTGSEAAFQEKLKSIWFQTFPRSGHGAHDSSGFEHGFLVEYKSSSEAKGLHNWVRMYLEEKAGRFNYLGYIRTLKPNMLKFTMTWMNRHKPVTSVFMGTSPEFDLALSTLCFLTSPGRQCRFSLAGTDFSLQTYDQSNIPGLQVAAAYLLL